VNTRLLIAVVLLLGLTGAVVATMRSHESETTIATPNVSLPKLNKDEITQIEIGIPQKSTQVTLQKQDDGWVLSAPVSAKADQSAVDSMLDKLAELEVSGIAASRKENYERLEVDDAHAIHVVAKGKDKTLADLYLGASKSGGTMLRVAGQEPVLRAKGSFRYAFDKEVKLFRDRVILDLESKDLTGLTLKSEKGTFKFEKAGGDAKWAQAKGEKAIPRFSEAKVQSLVSTLARLRAVDFATSEETASTTGLESPLATAVLTQADGNTVSIEIGKVHPEKSEHYVRVSGKEPIYRISKFTAERVMADASSFQEAEPKAGGSEPAAGAPIGGGGELPPEVLKQLQQQLGNTHP
jgi:hypothetical protein